MSKTKQINVTVGVDLSNPDVVYMGNDPELGELELVVSTDTPEEKAQKEEKDQKQIEEIDPTIDNQE